MSRRAAYSLFIAGFVLLLGLSGAQFSELVELGEQHELLPSTPIADVPPEYALFTTALGGFRGLLVDLLWLRAIKLQKEGKFFEIVQLYDWIGKLEPTLEDIWAMNAHNLAYNVSMAMPKREDRWRWIQRGLEMLKDHGLRYNPKSQQLHYELSWFYLDRVGGRRDDYHWHYKTHLALKMQRTLGWLQPDLEAIAAAPETVEELNADEDVAAFSQDAEALGISLPECHGDLLWPEAKLSPEQLEFLGSEDRRAALKKVSAFYAARALRDDWRLQPGRMLRLREEYGPIDWRLSDSLAFYWSSIARELSEKETERENSNRIFYFAFANLFRRGRLFLEPQGRDHMYITQPELRFAKRLNEYFEETLAEAPNARWAHEAFLEELVYTLFSYNQENAARKHYKLLGDKYPKGRYKVPFDQFINNHLAQDIKSANYNQILVMLNGQVRQALWYRAIGQEDRFTGHLTQASRIWTLYMKTRGDPDSPRLALPSLKVIEKRVLSDALNTGSSLAFPPILRQRLEELGYGAKSGSSPKGEE